MVKKKTGSQTKTIRAALVAFGLVLIIYVVFFSNSFEKSSDDDVDQGPKVQARSVSCDIGMYNPITERARITTVNCDYGITKCSITPYEEPPTNPSSDSEDDVFLYIQSGNSAKAHSETLDCGWFSCSKSVTMKLCVPLENKEVSVKIKDKDGWIGLPVKRFIV